VSWAADLGEDRAMQIFENRSRQHAKIMSTFVSLLSECERLERLATEDSGDNPSTVWPSTRPILSRTEARQLIPENAITWSRSESASRIEPSAARAIIGKEPCSVSIPSAFAISAREPGSA